MTGVLRRAALVVVALLASACGTGGFVGSSEDERSEPDVIVIGSKDYTESIIVAKLYGEALAAHGYTVEYRHTLDAPDVLTPASDTTGIHLFPEYIGPGDARLAAALAPDAMTDRATDAAAEVPGASAEADHALLAVAPAAHSEGLAVTRATAEALGIATMTDLAAHSGELVFGAAAECAEIPTCLPGLADVYGLEFARVEPIDALGLRYQALTDGEIHVAAVVTTDPEIAADDLVVLADDRGFYPAFHVYPMVDRDYLEAAPPDFASVVNAVSVRLTTSALSTLNARVEIDLRDPTDVAIQWLREQGITE